MNNPLNERLSEAIEKSLALISDEIEDDTDRYAHLQAKRTVHTRESMDQYKQYLLTLDANTLSSIVNLGDGGESVFVTSPVEIRDIHDIALTYRHYDLFCGHPDLDRDPAFGNAYPLFAIPKGKYRFVLIAVPVEDDL